MDAPKPSDSTKQDIRLSRRQFLLRNATLLASAYAGVELGERNQIETTFHRVPMKNLSAPVRVTQVSDLHRSWCVSERFIAHCIDKAIQTKPDVVLHTGDFVTGSAMYSESCVPHLKRLQAPMGQYAVLGNHDWGCAGGRHGGVAYHISQADVRVLTNRSFVLDNGLQIVGIDDALAGTPRIEQAFEKVEWDRPVLTMTHNPVLFRKLCQYPCLTLAGHTHGGQINLPVFTPLVMKMRVTHRATPSRYERGWVREENAPGRMYVSRGLGVVQVPLRFRARPEIVVFDLIPA
jgi:uncharacterized protein